MAERYWVPLVGVLVVFGRGVVGGEEDAEELGRSDLRGVVGDADGFGVAGGAAADGVVVRGLLLTAGVTGDDILDAVRGFRRRLRCTRSIRRRRRGLRGVVPGLGEIDGGLGEVGRAWAGRSQARPKRVESAMMKTPGKRRFGFTDTSERSIISGLGLFGGGLWQWGGIWGLSVGFDLLRCDAQARKGKCWEAMHSGHGWLDFWARA